MNDLKLAHAIFDYYSECYTMAQLEEQAVKMCKIINQIVEEDIKPAILRIEQRKDELQ